MALYLFTLTGSQPAGYISHGQGYDLAGQPMFWVAQSYAYDTTGRVIYRLVDEYLTAAEGAAWPALYFNRSDVDPEQILDQMGGDPSWVAHLEALCEREDAS